MVTPLELALFGSYLSDYAIPRPHTSVHNCLQLNFRHIDINTKTCRNRNIKPHITMVPTLSDPEKLDLVLKCDGHPVWVGGRPLKLVYLGACIVH